MCIFGYSGRPGWPINNQIGPNLLPSYPFTYINLHIKYGSNLFWIFCKLSRSQRNVCGRGVMTTKHSIPPPPSIFVWGIHLNNCYVPATVLIASNITAWRFLRRDANFDKLNTAELDLLSFSVWEIEK